MVETIQGGHRPLDDYSVYPLAVYESGVESCVSVGTYRQREQRDLGEDV